MARYRLRLARHLCRGGRLAIYLHRALPPTRRSGRLPFPRFLRSPALTTVNLLAPVGSRAFTTASCRGIPLSWHQFLGVQVSAEPTCGWPSRSCRRFAVLYGQPDAVCTLRWRAA
ncbi:hypothetical protein GUJ93_ZPchr0005g14449 [Zizania palustris]|uniref:Uncharacterized protein n=1 Tax=Zizania palustris TaxID=103762 RepID=A0A8J5SAP6_ZIZPA|nr:hypothetical protein GUJ93_ZPchr0005g14449 [Zizania palustris]